MKSAWQCSGVQCSGFQERIFKLLNPAIPQFPNYRNCLLPFAYQLAFRCSRLCPMLVRYGVLVRAEPASEDRSLGFAYRDFPTAS